VDEWGFILFDMLKKVLDFYTKYFAVWVIVPLFVGFGVRHYFKDKIEKVLPVFPAVSVTFIIFICIITASVMAELWRKRPSEEGAAAK
jgi:predicted Na+-dependent transporter